MKQKEKPQPLTKYQRETLQKLVNGPLLHPIAHNRVNIPRYKDGREPDEYITPFFDDEIPF